MGRHSQTGSHLVEETVSEFERLTDARPGTGGPQGRDCLSKSIPAPPVAAPDETALEVAALMAKVRSTLVAVVDNDKAGARLLEVITTAHLLERLLAAAT